MVWILIIALNQCNRIFINLLLSTNLSFFFPKWGHMSLHYWNFLFYKHLGEGGIIIGKLHFTKKIEEIPAGHPGKSPGKLVALWLLSYFYTNDIQRTLSDPMDTVPGHIVKRKSIVPRPKFNPPCLLVFEVVSIEWDSIHWVDGISLLVLAFVVRRRWLLGILLTLTELWIFLFEKKLLLFLFCVYYAMFLEGNSLYAPNTMIQ